MKSVGWFENKLNNKKVINVSDDSNLALSVADASEFLIYVSATGTGALSADVVMVDTAGDPVATKTTIDIPASGYLRLILMDISGTKTLVPLDSSGDWLLTT